MCDAAFTLQTKARALMDKVDEKQKAVKTMEALTFETKRDMQSQEASISASPVGFGDLKPVNGIALINSVLSPSAPKLPVRSL